MRNASGAPISGVTVSIASQSLQATTDARGSYRIPNVKVPASFSLAITASKIGQVSQTVTKFLNNDRSVRVGFVLASA